MGNVKGWIKIWQIDPSDYTFSLSQEFNFKSSYVSDLYYSEKLKLLISGNNEYNTARRPSLIKRTRYFSSIR